MSFPAFVPIGVAPRRRSALETELAKVRAREGGAAAEPQQLSSPKSADDAAYESIFPAPQPTMTAEENALYNSIFGA